MSSAPPHPAAVAAGAPRREGVLQQFSTITLAELDERAGLLERVDTKYIVRRDVLARALERWAPRFDALAIDGRRSFRYDNRYFDDPSLQSFRQHHQGRRIRFKVRTRRYLDSDLCFVEVKLKGPRGVTLKKRRAHPCGSFGTLDDAAWTHIRSSYLEVYGRPFTSPLSPSLDMRFRRATLVAKDGAERITLDYDIAFHSAAGSRRVPADITIVETKAVRSARHADRVLRDLGQRPVPRCSKYCIGVAALHPVERFNKFRAAMRKLDLEIETRLESMLGRAPCPYEPEDVEENTREHEFRKIMG